MALKYGRSTPKTTDPQGNRIADPDVYGQKTNEGVVSSWPEIRKMYQTNKLTDKPGDKPENVRQWNPKVKAYLSGNTNALDDTQFEEPVLSVNALGQKSFQTNYKTGSKSYNNMAAQNKSQHNSMIKSGKEFGDNIVPQYDSGATFGYAPGSTTDINAVRTKVIKSKTNIIPPPPPPAKEDPSPESMDMSNLRLKPLPAGKLPMKGGKLKEGPAAPEEWNAPELRKRSKVKATILKRKNGETAQNAVFNGRTISRTKPDRLEYNREKKTSAAYFGDNVFVGEVTGKNAAELKGMKKETKQIRNEALSRGSIKSALALQKDVKQLRLSGGYAKKGDISKQYGTGKIMEGNNSKLDYFTAELTKGVNNEKGITERAPGAMAGYREDKAYKKQQAFSEGMSNFKSQTSNAANANTIPAQQDKLAKAANSTGTPSVRRTMLADAKTNNPGMTNREVRKNVRSTIKSDRNLQKKVDEDMRKKGMI